MTSVLRNWLLVIRSAAMGVFVGLLPGIGGSLAQWLSYASARQTVRGGTETFGTGDIRGVIAPESANNAVDGGQLVPTLFFGVPGSVGMALFLGLLIILDVRPGPDMLNDQLPLTMTIAFSLVMANVLATGMALGFTPLLTRIAFVRPNILVPIILAVMTIAAFQANRSIYDLVVMLVFGALGYFMKSYGWPRPPIIIAVVLGGIIERFYNISSGAFDWVNFSSPTEGVFTRPAVIIIILIAVGTALYTVRMQRSVNRTVARQEAEFAARTEPGAAPPAGASDDESTVQPSTEPAGKRKRPLLSELLQPTPSGVFIALLTIAFAFTLWQTFEWTNEAARLPRVITVAGLVLIATYATFHLVVPSSGGGRIMDIGRTRTDDDRRVLMLRTFKAIGTTFGLVLAIWLIGFQIAVPGYVFLYLFFFGHVRWWVALGWLIVFIALIYGFFDEVIHIPWIDPVFGDLLPDLLKGRETITQFWGRIFG